MRIWILFSAVIFLSVLQAVFFNDLRIFGAAPDLLFIGVMFLGIYTAPRQGISLSVACGVLKDLYGLHQFGNATFLFPLWYLLIRKVSQKISLESSPVLGAVIFSSTFINHILLRLFFIYKGIPVPFFYFVRVAATVAVYNLCLSLVLYRLFKKIIRK
ncbi:MAG: rod shape-determining protein MreD [Candidatus Omnitrophota bacterium]